MDRNRTDNNSEFLGKVSTQFQVSNSNYRPKSLDYDQVELPDFYRDIVEKLAENFHEEWVTLLVKNGWTYGELRFDRRMANKLADYIPNYPERIMLDLERGKYEWKYGVLNNDRRKKHPSLVPFKDLNGYEKNYNRIKAENFLKSLLLLGYEVKVKE